MKVSDVLFMITANGNSDIEKVFSISVEIFRYYRRNIKVDLAGSSYDEIYLSAKSHNVLDLEIDNFLLDNKNHLVYIRAMEKRPESVIKVVDIRTDTQKIYDNFDKAIEDGELETDSICDIYIEDNMVVIQVKESL